MFWTPDWSHLTSNWTYRERKKRGARGVLWGLGNKRILLCHQRGSTLHSSPFLWRQFFTFWELKWWLQGGGRVGRYQESLMVGDADFKVIFNFKPYSPHDMSSFAPDTVLPILLQVEVCHPSFLFFFYFLSQPFVMVAFKRHYSLTKGRNSFEGP